MHTESESWIIYKCYCECHSYCSKRDTVTLTVKRLQPNTLNGLILYTGTSTNTRSYTSMPNMRSYNDILVQCLCERKCLSQARSHQYYITVNLMCDSLFLVFHLTLVHSESLPNVAHKHRSTLKPQNTLSDSSLTAHIGEMCCHFLL